MTAAAATVLIHGLFSSSRTWDPLVSLLESDSDISNPLKILLFDYSSPKWNWRVTRRIPDLSTVADSLSTFIEVECAAYDRLILVGHSQGGLIIQTYLAKMLADGRGLDLGKIRRVVLLACPNNGSELLLLFRKSAKFWSHPQERELRPLAASIVDVQRRVLSNVVFADTISRDHCPIPFAVYAGESDNVVTRASANSVFPHVGALPGDHNSILRATSTASRTFTTLKANLMLALREPMPPAFISSQQPTQRIMDPPQDQRELSKPIIRITQTITQNEITRSREIEIFDAEAADLWIRRDGASFTIQSDEGGDAHAE